MGQPSDTMNQYSYLQPFPMPDGRCTPYLNSATWCFCYDYLKFVTYIVHLASSRIIKPFHHFPAFPTPSDPTGVPTAAVARSHPPQSPAPAQPAAASPAPAPAEPETLPEAADARCMSDGSYGYGKRVRSALQEMVRWFMMVRVLLGIIIVHCNLC